MKKIVLAIGIFIGLTAHISSAQTTLGSDYMGGSFGLVVFEDDDFDEVFGHANKVSVFRNINIDPKMDLRIGGGHIWADGEIGGIDIDISGTIIETDLVYAFNSYEGIRPYVGAGISVVEYEVKASAFGTNMSDDETNVGVGGIVGAEYALSEKVLLNTNLDYSYIDDEKSIELKATAGYWFTDTIMGNVATSHEFDSDANTLSLGIHFNL